MQTAFVQKHYFFRQLDNLKRILRPRRPRQAAGLALQIRIVRLRRGCALLPQLAAQVGKRNLQGFSGEWLVGLVDNPFISPNAL